MLPYTPLHHLLMAELGFPVVATSGNLSDEPICTDEREALERLARHRRFISRPQPSDCPARGRFHRARDAGPRNGFASRARLRAAAHSLLKPIARSLAESSSPLESEFLAVGAHLKNAVALSVGRQVFISQHIGDLETEPAYAAFRRVIADFAKTLRREAGNHRRRLHPDYLSTANLPRAIAGEKHAGARVGVQHHIAHVLVLHGGK